MPASETWVWLSGHRGEKTASWVVEARVDSCLSSLVFWAPEIYRGPFGAGGSRKDQHVGSYDPST